MKRTVQGKKPMRPGSQRRFTGPGLTTISFPLGGIGTGSVGLSGRGGLVDWEIFNRPSIGSVLPRTFPIIWTREKGKPPVCRVIEAPPNPPYQGKGGGDPHGNGEGLPHMDSCTFCGEYPFAWIEFRSRRLPVRVTLDAYNPFIPSDADASGYPAAILRYTLTNRTANPVDATVVWSLFNAVGSIGAAQDDPAQRTVEFGLGKNVNQFVECDGIRGLLFTSEKWPLGHPRNGSMALTTPAKSVTVMRYWLRTGWFSPMHEFWDTFSHTGRLPEHDYGPTPDGQSSAGALGVCLRLKPGETRTVLFYITWYFPNFEKYWGQKPCACASGQPTGAAWATWPNYYANRFTDAFDVARQLHREERRLREESMRFHDALFGTTAPPFILDAVSSQMSTLKTTTCLRLTDGTFYGFEGCMPSAGCCEGSCTHVWNYQQTLPFLFPELERSMRSADYRYNMRQDGGMCFRLQLPLGSPPNEFHACGDGQMGGIIKLYRDWKISGDDNWLKSLWPDAQRALEYAWVQWDADRDGVMEGVQHNTYDIEFVGPNPLMTIFYLGALTAAAEIADHLGETEKAAEYRSVFMKGKTWIEQHLFNGEYFIQLYDPDKASEFQFGTGCLSDQLLGQWTATVAGLGHLLDSQKLHKALCAVYKYNWRKNLSEHPNPQRVYALNDEAGLLVCSWPRGGRPAIPFPYSDEVWTGIEYHVAAHLIWEGYSKKGFAMVKAARDRHDGVRRNPWNEFECGFHYARAMSAYGLLLAVSGFTFDKGAGRLGFRPHVQPRAFRTFWALDGVWGTYEQNPRAAALDVLWGKMLIQELTLGHFAKSRRISVHLERRGTARPIACTLESGAIRLAEPVALRAGDRLTIRA